MASLAIRTILRVALNPKTPPPPNLYETIRARAAETGGF